jgi:hypothetical protein
MRDIEELRRVLVDHEGLAPPSDGLIEAATAGAARIHRRRRFGYAAGLVAVTAVVVAIPWVGASALRQQGSRPAASTPPYRGPLQVTVELAADSGFVTLVHGMAGSAQHLSVRGGGSVDSEVVVHDPGTFDPAPLLHGEPVTVQGHRGYYLPQLDLGKQTLPSGEHEVVAPAIGWQDRSGAWVVVYFGRDKAHLQRVAEAVRLGTARDLPAPYHLTYLPAGLTGVYAMSTDAGPLERRSDIGYGSDRSMPDVMRLMFGQARDLPLTIDVLLRGDYVDSHIADLGAPTKVAGLDTWYVTSDGTGWGVPAGGADLVVRFGRCLATIAVKDSSRFPYGVLKRIVEGARFVACENAATWTGPLP